MSFVGYIVAGVTQNGWMGLATGAVLLFVFAVVMTKKQKAKK